VDQTTKAVDRTEATIARISPVAEQVLTQLATDLQRTDRILATVEPRAGPLQDSLAITLGQTRALLSRLDSLAGTAQAVVVQNQDALRGVMDRLQHTGEMLEHFTDQVSRRPTRLLTGVTPPPVVKSDKDKDSTQVNRSHQ
jgi:ABC-type transporter Mla subunit MlaD